MPLSVKEIAVELLGLPAKSRALLAEKLIESLDEKVDEGAKTLWIKEAKKRSRQIKNGSVRCKPAKEALKQARLKLK